MKHSLLALLLLPYLALAADRFDPQDLRKSFIADCVSRGIQRTGDAEAATKLCTCTFETMAEGLTVAEYLEVDRIGRSGGQPDSVPAMRRVMPKLVLCRSR